MSISKFPDVALLFNLIYCTVLSLENAISLFGQRWIRLCLWTRPLHALARTRDWWRKFRRRVHGRLHWRNLINCFILQLFILYPWTRILMHYCSVVAVCERWIGSFGVPMSCLAKDTRSLHRDLYTQRKLIVNVTDVCVVKCCCGSVVCNGLWCWFLNSWTANSRLWIFNKESFVIDHWKRSR